MLHIGNRVVMVTNTSDDLQRGVHCLLIFVDFEVCIEIIVVPFHIIVKRGIVLKLIFYEIRGSKTLILIVIPRLNIAHTSIVS